MPGALGLVTWLFWMSAFGVLYGYVGYPVCLWLLLRARGARAGRAPANPRWPSVTMIVPVHNERPNIEAKMHNTRALRYPEGRLEILFVSDGSTDGTNECIREGLDQRSELIELAQRGGKASALNAGLGRARHDLIVFSDASIQLMPDALEQIVRPFDDARIGCVSGEDRIAGTGGEGMYGRYELFLRRLESDLHSIVGASGSFYAQRRELCGAFPAGLAPDFLSVLRTVERGFRAISEPRAAGTMSALDDTHAEFTRKVRTILRGMSTLARHRALLNPFRYGWFAVELFSHKVVRWLIPAFLAVLAVTSLLLARQSPVYLSAAVLQAAFYGSAVLALKGPSGFARSMPGKVSLFFTAANVATAAAWLKFLVGARQEIWTPSRR
jgi:cellulose synthase/poly-beta-1,6-N-acetylglucosamine synthase-like glycosyltransferase